jgi:UDP-N-acetylglucosamine 1-carboxyvinyltransferase
MEKFIIQGGVPLSGEIVPAGNKNAALPILAACLLTDEELVIGNVPKIRDVESMLGLLEKLGVKVAWTGDNEVKLQADSVSGTEVDEELANRIRASFLVAGPLLARFGEVKMPPPGGDTIGRRRLDAHLDAFRDMGAKVDGDVWIELSAPKDGLTATRIFMDEPSVMGTENALLAAALTPGPTTIQNAACEPHVQDLARLLTAMGATVDGIGSNVMTVHGRDKLGGAEHKVTPDHIEIASFMALAAVTGGDLRIRETAPEDLEMIRRQFRRLGLSSMVEGNDVLVTPEQKLAVRDDMGDAIPKIDDGPWPAFPADLT